jgi:hypothetical protein
LQSTDEYLLVVGVADLLDGFDPSPFALAFSPEGRLLPSHSRLRIMGCSAV